jgi:hypothetical protein
MPGKISNISNQKVQIFNEEQEEFIRNDQEGNEIKKFRHFFKSSIWNEKFY